MRQSKFSESQIVGILKEVESGTPVAEARQVVAIEMDLIHRVEREQRGGDRSGAGEPRGGHQQTDATRPGDLPDGVFTHA